MVSQMKIERVLNGFTQQKLADLTGLSQGVVSLIERGVRPKADEAAVLSFALGVPVAELFPEIYASSGPVAQVVRKPYKAVG